MAQSWPGYNNSLETVHLLVLGSALDYDGSGGAFYRVSMKYDVMDAFSITSGIVGYESGDNRFFKNIGDNDIFTGWDMSFYFARYFDDNPNVANPNLAEAGPFVLRHSRLTMIGSAMNIARNKTTYPTR